MDINPNSFIIDKVLKAIDKKVKKYEEKQKKKALKQAKKQKSVEIVEAVKEQSLAEPITQENIKYISGTDIPAPRNFTIEF